MRRLIVPILMLAGGCELPLESEPVPLIRDVIVLRDSAEFADWPHAAEVTGGGVISIAGMGRSGCGTLKPAATRRGNRIDVVIRAEGDYSPCPLSRWAWEPFLVRLYDLPPGAWQVRVAVAGQKGAVHAVVTTRD